MNDGNRLLVASLALFAVTAAHGVRSGGTAEALANHCRTWGEGEKCGYVFWCGAWAEGGICTDPQMAEGRLQATDVDGCVANGRMCP